MTFSYSIVIRTLGNTGEKYRRMLDAISRQTVAPEEVLVVIPHGYELDHQLGTERIVRSEKGMVTQRVVGIQEATGDYLLVLDDDLDFPTDFVEKLHKTLQQRNLDCVLSFCRGWNDGKKTPTEAPKPQKPSAKQLIENKIRNLRSAFTGQAFFTNRRSEFFDVTTTTAGHRTYMRNEQGLCSTGSFQCFFIKNEVAKRVRMEEELWLEQGRLTKYASFDDGVFYYKLYLQSGRIAYAQDTGYLHLDAAAGRQATNPVEAKRIRIYAMARNRIIFWHRHIWGNKKNLKTLAGGIYFMTNYFVYNLLTNITPRKWPVIGALAGGYCDAVKFIRNK
ncbi:MAG: glycosyltransferase [Bacteroidales bacterium]|nr:glycosyltransferase [Bacteroidales bacterium]